MNDEELARKSAYLMGESSAAAQAVAELDRRRAAGEDVSVYNVQRSWVVGRSAELVPLGKWRVDMPDGLYTQMPGDPPGQCDLRKVIGGYVYEVEPRTGKLAAASPPSEFGLKNGAQTARGVPENDDAIAPEHLRVAEALDEIARPLARGSASIVRRAAEMLRRNAGVGGNDGS